MFPSSQKIYILHPDLRNWISLVKKWFGSKREKRGSTQLDYSIFHWMFTNFFSGSWKTGHSAITSKSYLVSRLKKFLLFRLIPTARMVSFLELDTWVRSFKPHFNYALWEREQASPASCFLLFFENRKDSLILESIPWLYPSMGQMSR